MPFSWPSSSNIPANSLGNLGNAYLANRVATLRIRFEGYLPCPEIDGPTPNGWRI
jgi:hypothetical protein